MVGGRGLPFVAALAIIAAAADASAERVRKPLRYIFVGRDSLHVGRSPAIATAMDVADADGLRRVLPEATFGNSFPERRFLAWHGDPARARYVLIVEATVDTKRVLDVVEMFDEPLALVVRGDHALHAHGVLLGRASDDDVSQQLLLVDRSTSTLYDSGDGRVKAVADVDASAVGIRAKNSTAISAMLASLDALDRSARAVPVTLLAVDPRASHRRQPSIHASPPTFTGSLDADVLTGEMRGFRAQVLSCYARELFDDPAIEGPLTLELDVAEDGAVTDARAFGPPAVATCTLARAGALHLTPPARGTATVTVRMNLRP